MRINRNDLNDHFVDQSTIVTKNKFGLVLNADARRVAQFLIKLRKVAQLCGMYEQGLEIPTGRANTKGIFNVEKSQCKNLIKILLRFQPSDFERLRETYPDHRFCPYTEALLSALMEHKYSEIIYYWMTFGKLLDDHVLSMEKIVLSVRDKVTGKEFKAAVSQHERAANKNSREAWKYIRNLFRRYARLLVVRVDFHYRGEFSQGTEKITYEEAREHRTKLLRSMRYRKEFKSLAGMIWKVEYAPIKGYHVHGIFFYDGNKRKNLYPVWVGLSNFWVHEVTKGKGYTYAVDPKIHNYKYPCIGMMEYHEGDKLKGLRYAVEYLAKVDYLARLNVPGRLFGRMVVKPSQGKKLGRPRLRESSLEIV